MSKDNRGRSAHADGGATGVKKRFSLAARHRFFWQDKRNGVEWQDKQSTTSQRIGAHVPAPPQVGRETSRLPTGSAHANGGAAGVKKRLSLAARHRFFGQAPKKWGRTAGQAIDHLPTYRRTRTKPKEQIKGGTPGEGSPLDLLLRFNKHQEVPRSAERGQGLCPCTLPPLKRRAKLSFARGARSEVSPSWRRRRRTAPRPPCSGPCPRRRLSRPRSGPRRSRG